MSDNAFLKLVKGVKSCFPEIEVDTEHLRISDELQIVLNETLNTPEKNKQFARNFRKDRYRDPITYAKCLSIGRFLEPGYQYIIFYKYVLHMSICDVHEDRQDDYAKIIAKNAGYHHHELIQSHTQHHWMVDCSKDIWKIYDCLDWTDADHYYSPFYLYWEKISKSKKFVVPSMEIEAESEEEAKQIAASRLVLTPV